MNAWSSETGHPASALAPRSPVGQCGVTNFGFGLWLIWRRICLPEHLRYEEGEIQGPFDDVPGTHHAWITAEVDELLNVPALEVNCDLTPSQFAPAITEEVMARYPDYVLPGDLRFASRTSTPIAEYDISRFERRLPTFMARVVHQLSRSDMRNLGLPRRLDRLWWPDTSTANAFLTTAASKSEVGL